jgi:hypothetical protein
VFVNLFHVKQVNKILSHDLRARTELTQSQQVWVARGGILPRPWPAPEITEIEAGFRSKEDSNQRDGLR